MEALGLSSGNYLFEVALLPRLLESVADPSCLERAGNSIVREGLVVDRRRVEREEDVGFGLVGFALVVSFEEGLWMVSKEGSQMISRVDQILVWEQRFMAMEEGEH